MDASRCGDGARFLVHAAEVKQAAADMNFMLFRSEFYAF